MNKKVNFTYVSIGVGLVIAFSIILLGNHSYNTGTQREAARWKTTTATVVGRTAPFGDRYGDAHRINTLQYTAFGHTRTAEANMEATIPVGQRYKAWVRDDGRFVLADGNNPDPTRDGNDGILLATCGAAGLAFLVLFTGGMYMQYITTRRRKQQARQNYSY
jgi:hypothetical protein